MTFSLKKYNFIILLTYFVIFFALILITLFYVDFEIHKIIEKSFLLSESEKLKFIIEKNFIVFTFLYILLFIIFVSIIPFTLPGIILTSIILIVILWDKISLPYSNKQEVIGIYSENNHHQFNDTLRFIIFIFSVVNN